MMTRPSWMTPFHIERATGVLGRAVRVRADCGPPGRTGWLPYHRSARAMRCMPTTGHDTYRAITNASTSMRGRLAVPRTTTRMVWRPAVAHRPVYARTRCWFVVACVLIVPASEPSTHTCALPRDGPLLTTKATARPVKDRVTEAPRRVLY